MGIKISNDLELTGDVDFDKQPTVMSLLLAQYQRMSFKGLEFTADPALPGAVYGVTNGYPGWEFPGTVDSAILVPFAPPRVGLDGTNDIFWETLKIALVGINISAGAGNMLFQVQIGKYDIFLDSVAEAEFYDQSQVFIAGAQNVMSAYIYTATLNLTPGTFGTEWRMRISRLADASHPTDTLAGSFRLGVCSFNQAS